MAIATGWLRRVVVQDRIAIDGLLDELHIGEAEAIVLARELQVGRVLLDDRAARNKAHLMGLTVTGTVGILLLAQQAGVIENIRPELDRLIESNFRISRQLYKQLCSSACVYPVRSGLPGVNWRATCQSSGTLAVPSNTEG